jgi:hypothetical protein
VERENQNGNPAGGTLVLESLDRLHRMLRGAVVELHRGRLIGARGIQPASQVDVHDVEPARAHAQVPCLDVEDQLVALADLADE